MKKILKYSLIAVLGLSALAGCKKNLETDQFSGFSLAAIAPNPVMRGAQLRIVGNGLENVSEVQFAGGVSVTDIEVVAQGERSEIRITVPLEGPEVGPVTVISKDGAKASTRFNLEYTEPIVQDSFSPATALSGDEITIKGEYLYNVKCVIFGGDVKVNEFVSQSRNELKVIVPFNAVTGYVIVSDVDEVNDQTTIPNQIYSAQELVIGKPTVVTADKAVYKSGDEITVTGAHLDMIETVNLVQADAVEFSVSEDNTKIIFNLPAKATDGNITLVSYAGDEFDAGEIETVSVSDLSIKSLAEDNRYKAGCEVEITGEDLDLVTKVEFTGAEASWYYSDGKIIATQPAAAQDGAITVTLESGKQAYTEGIEVVKPEIRDLEYFDEYVAGKTVVTIKGEDLDLVTTVTIGDKDNGLIPCEFELITDESGYTDVKVPIPAQAYTGPITFTSDAGYQTSTVEITITYDLAVNITYDKDSYALGKKITISGSNLLQIESISIKGKKVMDYQVRADDAMSFSLPEDIVSPGVYRLDLVLTDGTELTWPVPFTVTAPFTETFIWEGSQIINGWSGVTFGDNRFIWSELGIKEGDVVKLYFTAPETGWWDLQLVNGHWGNLSIDELGGGNEIKQDAGFPGGAQTFSFNVTASVLASLTEDVGWGGAFIINGDGNVEVTGISLIQYGSTESVVWEGDVVVDNWDNLTDLGPETLFADAGLEAGMEVRFYVSGGNDKWKIQLFDGHWGGLTFAECGGTNQFNNENSDLSKGYFFFTATAEHVAALTASQGWGSFIIIQGEGAKHLTKITIK